MKSFQKSNWPLTINGKEKPPIRIKCILVPDHLKLEADVRKGGFFCSFYWRQHHEPNGLFSLTPAAILRIHKGWELLKAGGNRCIYSKLCSQPSSQTGSSPKACRTQTHCEGWEPCTGMCSPFSSLLFWGFTSRHEVLHRAHRVLLCSSTLLGIEGSPPAVPDKKQSVASLLLLKQEGQAVWGMRRDPRKGGTSRQGDTTDEVTDTNQIQAKQASERPTLPILPQHPSKSTKRHKIILTTGSMQCLHTTPPLHAGDSSGIWRFQTRLAAHWRRTKNEAHGMCYLSWKVLTSNNVCETHHCNHYNQEGRTTRN